MKKEILLYMAIFTLLLSDCAQKNNEVKKFTGSFASDSCTFINNGRNSYFILEPGYQLILERTEGNKKTRLEITVLNETRKIGNTETRIVEEKESMNDEIVEISRNFFALCKESGSIYYFGEEVDMYKKGKVVSHEGAWIAEGKNKAGIMVPGEVFIGARYYQEIAPGVALDRAEIISNEETLITPVGKFSNCLKVEETTPLEPKAKEYKYYAPEIGLIKDENLVLIKYGFKN